ncbi:MAG: 50S ribosomal protein L23 [Deltaproteobacteria bacterium]|jgi:large subunit ribosomal protein L23|nr:50S ribosomal protein L23 [Deltaproteobacteria bacterium]
MRSAEAIIKRPLLTEKGTFLKDTGGRAEEDIDDPESVSPQLLIEVARDANKIEIKRAVERLWNVSVLKVRTSIVPGKQKRVGRHIGRRSNWKRALVTLAPGQKIDFFEGV